MFVIDNESSLREFKGMLAAREAEVLDFKSPHLMQARVGSRAMDIELAPEVDLSTEQIIFGKNPSENIVNISVDGDNAYVFKEKDGAVTHEVIPYKHWVLAPKPYPGFTPLKGDQHFRYIQEYTADDFDSIRNTIYRLNLFSMHNRAEAFMVRHGYTYFKNTRMENVSALSFDIETTGLDPYASDARVLLITNTLRKNGVVTRKTFNVEDFLSQQEMIYSWADWVNAMDPSLLIGHNIMIFDLPYIAAQVDTLFLGRLDAPVIFEDKTRELRVASGQSYSYKRISIFGREIIDTFFLAIKADIAKKYTSYKLKSIIAQEGLEKTGRQHYDASQIGRHWENPIERAKIIQYAEEDSDDALKLYDLMIAPFFYLAPHVPKTFQMMIESASGSQVNSMMVRSYLQHGYSVAKATDVEPFEGAISMGIPGIYDNVLKVDVASLYPSIMRHYKIFPEGKDFNGNFLKALEYFTNERLKNKALAKNTGDRYYKDLEQAQKVFINSAYGFMGASGLNYNFGEGAADVTRKGREILIKAVEWATGHTLKKEVSHVSNAGKENEETEYAWVLGERVGAGMGFQLVNADTDSISITRDRSHDGNDATSISTRDGQKRLLILLNSHFPLDIRFEHDGYFNRFIVLKAKNYIMLDESGRVKLKGSGIKDQKKEPALREMLDKMIDCLLFKQPVDSIAAYNTTVKEALNVSDIRRWATKKTISKSILACATDPEARLNERKVWDAVANISVQEGDKVYIYPAILSTVKEIKSYKNGNVKEKIVKITGLKRAEEWSGDHDVDKLIERTYATAEILSSVLDMSLFLDYSLRKNKLALEAL